MKNAKAKSNLKKADKKRKLVNLSLIVFFVSIVIFTVLGALILDNFSYMQQLEDLSKLEEVEETYKGEIDDRLRFIAMQEEEMIALNNKNATDATSDNQDEKEVNPEEPEAIDLFLENEENPKTKFMEYNERYRKKSQDESQFVESSSKGTNINLQNLKLKNELPPASTMNMKVVIGDFSTKEAALQELAVISSQFSAPPFVKVVNGAYVIQVASFKTPETAYEFVTSLRQQGFSARIIEE